MLRYLLVNRMAFKVIILQEGYAVSKEGIYRASGSATLIKGDLNIIVDTGGPWERDKLLTGLAENGLSSEQIDVVVGTHGHSDHIGNLNLFPKAKQIVGFDINIGDCYYDNNLKEGESYSLVDNQIEVIPTPGHTHSDVSVVVYKVDGYGVIGICGDLFECESDDGIWQENSENQELQNINRAKMLQLCNYIIPGHGCMFKTR